MSGSQATRNSGLRKVAKNPIRRTVEAVGEKAPWITPDRITAVGVVGNFAANWIGLKYPKKKKVATGLHAGSSFADSFDGEWERWLVEEKGKEPSEHGPLFDALADKSQEIATFLFQAIGAKRKEKDFTSAAYLVAAVTSPLPALARARAESRGHVVKEGGMGTRPVRATMGAAGIAFSDLPIVPTVLATSAAAQNIRTATQRYFAAEPGSPHCVGQIDDPATIEAAQQRHSALQYMAVGGAIAVGATIAAQRFS